MHSLNIHYKVGVTHSTSFGYRATLVSLEPLEGFGETYYDALNSLLVKLKKLHAGVNIHLEVIK